MGTGTSLPWTVNNSASIIYCFSFSGFREHEIWHVRLELAPVLTPAPRCVSFIRIFICQLWIVSVFPMQPLAKFLPKPQAQISKWVMVTLIYILLSLMFCFSRERIFSVWCFITFRYLSVYRACPCLLVLSALFLIERSYLYSIVCTWLEITDLL